MRKVLSTPEAPSAIGPYSQAVEAGGFLFMSGQIPLTPNGDLITGDIQAQASQVMTNMKAVLAAAGLTFDDLVKTTIFLSDMSHFAAVNEIYGAVFTGDKPARSTVAVAGLPRGVDVEIEGIAKTRS